MVQRAECKECGAAVEIKKENKEPHYILSLECMDKHKSEWQSSEKLLKNKNNKQCNQTPIQHMVGAILSGMFCSFFFKNFF